MRVPFPYTDRPVHQYRPALVISRTGTGEDRRLVWVLMITSAENKLWPGDVDLGDEFREAGLPVPSLVRTAKVATIETTLAEIFERSERENRPTHEIADQVAEERIAASRRANAIADRALGGVAEQAAAG